MRETFRFTDDIDGREVLEFQAGGTRLIARTNDGLPSSVHGEHRCTSILPKWRPSIHMPRWASRITLEITSVKVERLRDISEEDAEAEGVEQDSFGHWFDYSLPTNYREAVSSFSTASASFMSLWNSINGKGSWESNPWVWAISFRRLP